MSGEDFLWPPLYRLSKCIHTKGMEMDNVSIYFFLKFTTYHLNIWSFFKGFSHFYVCRVNTMPLNIDVAL